VIDVLGTPRPLRDSRHLGQRRVSFMQGQCDQPRPTPRGGALSLQVDSPTPTPSLDLRTAGANAIILLFIATLAQPLVFAHANGFTVHGVELPERASRPIGMAASQQLARAAVGASQIAFMVGEYIGGARLTAAPIEFAPPPQEVCRTPTQRMRKLAAGASFLWCTLGARRHPRCRPGCASFGCGRFFHQTRVNACRLQAERLQSSDFV